MNDNHNNNDGPSYREGDIVHGIVVGIQPYGAFVEFSQSAGTRQSTDSSPTAASVISFNNHNHHHHANRKKYSRGLLHISKLRSERVEYVEDVVRMNEKLFCRVDRITVDSNSGEMKYSLSLIGIDPKTGKEQIENENNNRDYRPQTVPERRAHERMESFRRDYGGKTWRSVESRYECWSRSPSPPPESGESSSSSSSSESSRARKRRRRRHKHRTSRRSKRRSKSHKRRKRSPSTSSSSFSSSSHADDSTKKNQVLPSDMPALEDSSDDEGPKLPTTQQQQALSGTIPVNKGYGQDLLPGEGQGIASFLQNNLRIPRRGEIGYSAEEIDKYENSGYVMSGSRHARMNEVRLRKENQVKTVEEQRELARLALEERQEKEEALLADFKSMLEEKKRAREARRSK